jgi:hypothetical protein
MATGDLTVRVGALSAEEADELAAVTARLREELLELDVDAVEPVDAEPAPAGAKGFGVLVGALLVRLGSGAVLRAVLEAVRRWATASGREVEVTLGGDTLRLTGVSVEQQERILDAWLSRHAGDS